jgi:hypothetical protein
MPCTVKTTFVWHAMLTERFWKYVAILSAKSFGLFRPYPIISFKQRKEFLLEKLYRFFVTQFYAWQHWPEESRIHVSVYLLISRYTDLEAQLWAVSNTYLPSKHERRIERQKLDFLVNERMQRKLTNDKIRTGCTTGTEYNRDSIHNSIPI